MLFNQSIFYPKRVDKCFIDFRNIVNKDCFSIVKHESDLRALNNSRFKNWLQFDNFVVIGTGGSSLGGQTICALSDKKNVKFISNIDADTLTDLFSQDLSRTGFLCISKSGETLETIYTILLLISKVHDLKDRVVVVTEDKDSSLKKIAIENDFMCFDHPNTIGGRYSVFSLVGMIPAMIVGIDPKLIRLGGNRVLEDFANSIYRVQEGAGFVLNSLKHNLTQHISFIYSDKLYYFGKWLAQLYAESSGKNGKGVTPIVAQGSVDQHSQLQLYIDGPQDKCYTFMFENKNSDLAINNVKIPEKFAYLNGVSANDVLKAQYKATFASLRENDSFMRTIEIPELKPEALGALFMHFMLEVAGVCNILEINAFDQPAVERGKIITKELLENPENAF